MPDGGTFVRSVCPRTMRSPEKIARENEKFFIFTRTSEFSHARVKM